MPMAPEVPRADSDRFPLLKARVCSFHPLRPAQDLHLHLPFRPLYTKADLAGYGIQLQFKEVGRIGNGAGNERVRVKQ